MTPKARLSELIAVQTLREQRWAFDARRAHLSYREMRTLANRPEREGGLGYDLSEHALKRLVDGYRERMTEVEAINIDEHRERELADLDLVQREAAATIRATNAAIDRAAEIGALDVHATKLKLGAIDRYRVVGESRRKLLGIDAPQQIKADVVVRDALTEELNEMLARQHTGKRRAEEPSA